MSLVPGTEAVPDVAVGGPVLEEPAVGGFVLPADITSIFPQEFHLVTGVPRVPQGVPQILPWACV